MQKETQDYVFLFSGHKSNNQKFCAKYHQKILNFSRRGETFQKYVQTYPKIAIRIKTSFSDFQSNSKNICGKFPNKRVTSLQEIQKGNPKCPRNPSKRPTAMDNNSYFYQSSNALVIIKNFCVKFHKKANNCQEIEKYTQKWTPKQRNTPKWSPVEGVIL